MKKVYVLFILMIISFTAYNQTEKEVISMFKEDFHENDSITQKIILNNSWQLIYSYEMKAFGGNLEKINFPNILKFENDKYYEIYPNKPDINDTGDYFIDNNLLFLYRDSDENTYFDIANLFNNEYLVLQCCKLRGRKHNKLRSINIRLMFKKIESPSKNEIKTKNI